MPSVKALTEKFDAMQSPAKKKSKPDDDDDDASSHTRRRSIGAEQRKTTEAK